MSLQPLGPYTSPPFVWIWDFHNVLLVIKLGLEVILTFSGNCSAYCRSLIGEASYGKTVGKNNSIVVGGFLPKVNPKLAWVLMESPTIFLSIIFYFFVGGDEIQGYELPKYRFNPVPLVLFSLYELHYIHRTLVMPCFLKTGGGNAKGVSLMVVIQ